MLDSYQAHDHQARPFDELGRAQTSSRYGKDAVGISLNYQRRHMMRARSSRKSSCQVGTNARLAVAEALAATFQLACRASVEVLSWPHYTTRGCVTLGRASIVLWYRSADVEISGRAFQD